MTAFAQAISMMGAAGLPNRGRKIMLRVYDGYPMQKAIVDKYDNTRAQGKGPEAFGDYYIPGREWTYMKGASEKPSDLVKKAEKFAEKIETPVQAQGLVVQGIRFLRLAAVELSKFSALDTQWSSAYVSRISQVASYGQKIQKEEKPFDEHRKRVALFLAQAAQVLRDARRDAKISQAENSLTGLMEQFADAIREVLGTAVRIVPQAVPDKIWYSILAILGLGLVFAIIK